MNRVFIFIFLVLSMCSIVSIAHAESTSLPGRSGLSEYQESLPTAGGSSKVSKKHSNGSSQDPGSVSSDNFTSPEGQLALNAADETGKQSARNKKQRGFKNSANSGGSASGSGDDEISAFDIAIVILIASAVASLFVWGVLRRRRMQRPNPTAAP